MKMQNTLMSKTWMPVLALGLILVASAQPAAAQAASEARGTVSDHEGNPMAGVTVVFHAESNPALEYKGKTSKKGRYFIPGLFTGKEGDMWVIRVEGPDGLIPIEMTVESRTAQRVLIADPRTVTLGPNQEIPPIVIRPLGSAQVDFTLGTIEMARAKQAEANPEAAAAAQAQAQQQAQQRQTDPYEAALTKAQSGDLLGSLKDFGKALEDEPEDGERHRAYAQVLYRLDRLPEAQAEAQRAVELSPRDINAHMVLYGIYVKQGDLDAAGQSLEAARAIDPTNIDLLKQVAFVAGESGSVEEQIAAYEAIAVAAPTDPEAWLSLGDLYAQQGNNAKSEEAYQKVIELDPANADQIFFNLGALLMNNDERSDSDTQKAIGAFRKAVEVNPKYAQAYRELAFALLNTGDRDGARDALESYVKVSPNAPDAEQMKKLLQSL